MRLSRYWLCLLMAPWCAFCLAAEHVNDTVLHSASHQKKPEKKRPRIGLVLGGGGAKGAAHVGVLKVLDDMNIPIDFVVGTSMGSVVGGLYAMGYDVDTIESKLFGTRFTLGYSDTIPREQLSFRNKQLRDQFNIPLNLGISDHELKVPSGILHGQSMKRIIRELTGLVPTLSTFDDLALPYRAIAADVVTRERVVIDHGSIGLAMRASSSVPGVLAPVEYDNRLLVDGGIVDNLPIEVAHEMGAEIVIAVDIGDGFKERDDLDSTVAVVQQLTAFLTGDGTKRSATALRESDIYIRPNIDGMATTDFSVMPMAIKEGVRAAMAAYEKLEPLAVSKQEYQTYVSNRARSLRRIHRESLLVSGIIMNKNSNIHPDYVQSRFQLTPGELVNLDTLQQAVDRVYATDEFQRVDLTIDSNQQNQDTLRLWFDRKSWGPHYLWLGFAWEENITEDSYVDFDIAYIMRDLTPYGAEWRNHLGLGDDSLILTELYAPLIATRWLYSRSSYAFKTETWDYIYDDFSFVTFDKKAHVVETGLGVNLTNTLFAEVGWSSEVGAVENDVDLNEFYYDAHGPYFKLGYDTLDSISFPTMGNRLIVSAYYREEDANGIINSSLDLIDSKYRSQSVAVEWKGAFSLGGHTLVGKAEWEQIESDEDVSVYFSRLGGFLNLSGFERDELNGAKKAFGALIYQWNVGDDLFKLSNVPIFIGLSYELGNVWSSSEEISLDTAIRGGSFFLGTETPLGPVALAYGTNERDQNSVYFYLGKHF